jgi:hypothetical protein
MVGQYTTSKEPTASRYKISRRRSDNVNPAPKGTNLNVNKLVTKGITGANKNKVLLE